MLKDESKEITVRERIKSVIVAVFFSVIILILALAWNSWLYHVVYEVLGSKSTQNRTIYVLLVTAISLIVILSLTERLSPDINIVTL